MEKAGHLRSEDIQYLINRLSLDPQRFKRDKGSTAIRKIIDQDIQLGESLGVQGTPAFFLCCPDGRVIRLGAVQQVEGFLSIKVKQ